jgi:hypothetical protein
MWNDLKSHHDAGTLSDVAFGGWSVLILGLNLLNVTWAYKLIMGFVKIVFGKKKKKSA